MSSFVLSMALACALLFSILFWPISSAISGQQPTLICVNTTASCSPPDLAALHSMAAAFPPPLFTRWQLDAAAHNCCGHWGPLTIICSFCFTPNSKHSSATATASGIGRVTKLAIDQIDSAEMSSVGFPISLCSLSALTSLRLVGYLSGAIPDCIGNNLTHLVHLDLSRNYGLTGSIPLSFSRLPSLQVLDLGWNSLSGAFPDFLSHQLAYLYLNDNSFSNYISGSLSSLFQASNLTSLQSMRISYNQLKGVIPNFIPFHFSSLSQIELDGNLLDGSLPESICGLINLSILSLTSNAFSGQINTLEMCNITKFEILDMSENLLTGPFPDWLGSLSNLTSLHIANNNLSGSLPYSWKNLTSLYHLDLSGNSVLTASKNPSGPKLPCWLFALPSLRELYLSSMKLQATDLAEICSSRCDAIGGISLLASLDLSKNLFSPDILHCFSKITVFQPPIGTGYPMLNLSGNPLELDLSSPNALKLIPKALGSLDLSFCMLRGHLTNLFFERLAPSVSFLYLAHNHLEGQIPAELGNMSQLSTVDLSNNFFAGLNSPLTNGGLVGWNLDLSNNRLAGNLSSLLSRIVPNVSTCGDNGCLDDLDLSHNFLEGAIPPFLFQYHGTWRLKLSHNHLRGSLPNVPFPLSLGVLSLSNNQLSGQIPSSFRYLPELLLLDLSHNMLQGNLENIPLFSNASFQQLRVLLDLGQQ